MWQTGMAAPTIALETSLNIESRKSAFPCFVCSNSGSFEEIVRYASNKIDQGKVKANATSSCHTPDRTHKRRNPVVMASHKK